MPSCKYFFLFCIFSFDATFSLSFFKSFRKLLRSLLSLSFFCSSHQFSFTRNFPRVSTFPPFHGRLAFPISARISKIPPSHETLPPCMDFWSDIRRAGTNWLCQEREVRVVKVQGWVSFFGTLLLSKHFLIIIKYGWDIVLGNLIINYLT